MEGRPAEETLQEYIHTAASIHQERMDFLKEANHVIAADYVAVETEMGSMREDQGRLNHQIDALINSFSMVDVIEADVARTEANLDLIAKAVNRINKRIIELKKNKGKKK